jgi:hypothetical protein
VGVGLVFPRGDRPIAVEWAGHAVSTLRPIEGLEFVEETVAAPRDIAIKLPKGRVR